MKYFHTSNGSAPVQLQMSKDALRYDHYRGDHRQIMYPDVIGIEYGVKHFQTPKEVLQYVMFAQCGVRFPHPSSATCFCFSGAGMVWSRVADVGAGGMRSPERAFSILIQDPRSKRQRPVDFVMEVEDDCTSIVKELEVGLSSLLLQSWSPSCELRPGERGGSLLHGFHVLLTAASGDLVR